MIHLNFSLTYIELYLVCINFITFLIYSFDKLQAIQNKRNIIRVPEIKLLTLTFLGGSVGGFIAMILFRHKIKKLSFVFKFIITILLQFLVYYFILKV